MRERTVAEAEGNLQFRVQSLEAVAQAHADAVNHPPLRLFPRLIGRRIVTPQGQRTIEAAGNALSHRAAAVEKAAAHLERVKARQAPRG